MTGVDTAADALAVARAHDASGRARYLEADALSLPFEDGSFDAVCAMDFLEHVEAPERAIAEASRVLAPGGLFFFQHVQPQPLVVARDHQGRGVVVQNAPPHMHVLRLFLKPREVRKVCLSHGFAAPQLMGARPKLTLPFWKSLFPAASRVTSRSRSRARRGWRRTGVARKRPGECGPAQSTLPAVAEAVFTQSPMIICILEGPRHTITFANPAYRRLLGRPDPIGKDVMDVSPSCTARGGSSCSTGSRRRGSRSTPTRC